MCLDIYLRLGKSVGVPPGQRRETLIFIPDQTQKRWPLEPTSSRKSPEHLISHSWGHVPGVEASEATTVHFLPLQVTGPGEDPPGNGPPKPRVQPAGAETPLAGRSGPGAAQGRGPLGGSRQNAREAERS